MFFENIGLGSDSLDEKKAKKTPNSFSPNCETMDKFLKRLRPQVLCKGGNNSTGLIKDLMRKYT